MTPRVSAITAVKLWLDMLMTVGFIASLAFRLTGDEAHEWIGFLFCVLFIVHNVLNISWYKTLHKGLRTLRGRLNTILNVLLVICMLVLCVSGVINSRFVFSFLQLEGSMAVRQAHSLAAYWALVLIGLHVGMHWRMLAEILRRVLRLREDKTHSRLPVFSGVLLGSYGAWAFYERDMGAKLFQGFAFDFWNPELPDILFYTHNFAMIMTFALLAHSVLKCVTPKRPAKTNAPGTTPPFSPE